MNMAQGLQRACKKALPGQGLKIAGLSPETQKALP